MATDSILKPRSGHKAIRVGDGGTPSIEGFRCNVCGAATCDKTMACRNCGSRDALTSFRGAETGKVFTWTVVHRSYPGIKVPFVSAIVDLDDGLALKGTLRNVDPGAVRPGMPVRVIFDDAGGACDSEGAPYVGFHFEPEGISA